MAKRDEIEEAEDRATRTAVKVARELQKEKENEDDDSSDDSDRSAVSATEVVPVPKKSVETESHGIDDIMNNIPANERAKLRFFFYMKKPGTHGAAAKVFAGDYPAAGDDWTNKIKQELARLKGPGAYEGRAKYASGTSVKADPWVFDIDESFALDWGWQADKPEEAKLIGAPVAEKVVVTKPAEGPVKANRVAEAQEDLAILKIKVEAAKVEKELATHQAKDEPVDKKGPVNTADPDLTKQLINAERARLDAEHKAELARINAEREATLLKEKNDHDKAMAALENQRLEDKRRADEALVAEKRRAEDAMNTLRADITRKEDANRSEISDVKMKLDRVTSALENKRDEKPEKPDYTAISTAVAAVFAPFAPVANALAKKMMQDPPPPPTPPPPPDVAGMLASFAEAMKSLQPPPPPPPKEPPDPTKLLEKSIDMVMTKLKPAEQPPSPPPVNPMDMMKAAFDMVKAATPAPVAPVPVAPVAAPVDPMTFTKQVMEIAQGFAQMSNGGRRDRDDDDEGPSDPFDTMIEAKTKLERLGVTMNVGNVPPPPPPEKKTVVKEIFEGVKEALPSFGEAIAKTGYFQSKAAEAQAKASEQQEALRKNIELKKLREQNARRQRFYQNQNAARQAQQQPQYQQPQPQQAPQPQPRQPAQVTRASQPPAPIAKPRPQATPGANRFAPAPTAPRPQSPQVTAPTQPVNQDPQQPKKPLPTSAMPYGLPAVKYTPRAQMPPAPFPVAEIPRRPPPRKSAVPVEHLVRVPVDQIPQQRQAPQQQAPQQQQAPRQQLTPEQQAAQRAAMEKRANFARHVQSAAGRPPLQAPQKPQQQAQATQSAPQQARPQPPVQQAAQPGPKRVLEELASDNAPTDRTWGGICNYVIPAIGKQDPEATALYLLENYPHSISMLVGAVGTNVDFLQAGLGSMAAKAGQYGPVVSDLAARIGTEPAKTWAGQLLAALNGGK